MKKILMISAALSALALPASAGPILEDMISDGMSWQAGESAVMDGAETYSDLTITGHGSSVTLKTLQVQRTEGVISADFEEMNFMPGRPEAVSLEAGKVRLDQRIFDLGPRGIEKMLGSSVLSDPTSDQSCGDLDMPFSIDLTGLEANGNPNAALSIEEVGVTYGVVGADTDCIMDMDLMMTGLSMTEETGFSADIGGLGFDVYWSMLNARAPLNEDVPYTARFAMVDTVLGMGGTEQARIDKVTSNSSMDPASLKGLIEAGYFEAYHDMVMSELTGAPMDFSKISVPAIWNAVRDIVSDGSFEMSGAVITGDIAQALSGSKFLARGRSLDMSMRFDQDGPDVATELSIDSADLFSMDAKIAMTIDEMDPALAEMGPGALMMTAPVSFGSLSVFIEDEALGDILAEEMGIDPYMAIEPSLLGLVGPTKAKMVADWVARAQDGGTYFAAAPDAPLPVMQAFAALMGDWTVLGGMINATTTKE